MLTLALLQGFLVSFVHCFGFCLSAAEANCELPVIVLVEFVVVDFNTLPRILSTGLLQRSGQILQSSQPVLRVMYHKNYWKVLESSHYFCEF